LATSAERQRRYIGRLKAAAAAPQNPDAILAAIAELKPRRLADRERFARRLVDEAARLCPAVKKSVQS
jgi:hypothetical protein